MKSPATLRSRRHAFTLPEMLTGATLSSILVGLMLALFNGSTTVWQQAAQRIDTVREARAALEQMERDLAQVVRAGTLPTLFMGHDPQAADHGNEAVYALASLPGEEALTLLGYECRWDATARGYVLMRVSDRGGALALPKEGSAAYFDRTGSDRMEEPLARYVWDVRIRPGRMDGTVGDYPDGAVSLPPWIEVRFKVAGPATLQRIKNAAISPQTWANPQDPVYRALIAPHQQEYVARIRLHAAP